MKKIYNAVLSAAFAAIDAIDAQTPKRKRILSNILIGIASVAFGLFFNGFGPYGPDWLPRLY
jgi:uncharacterized membrane protein YjjP (DUF1212 family)